MRKRPANCLPNCARIWRRSLISPSSPGSRIRTRLGSLQVLGAEHQGVTIRRVPHLKLGNGFIVGRGLSMLTYFVGAAVTALFAPARTS